LCRRYLGILRRWIMADCLRRAAESGNYRIPPDLEAALPTLAGTRVYAFGTYSFLAQGDGFHRSFGAHPPQEEMEPRVGFEPTTPALRKRSLESCRICSV